MFDYIGIRRFGPGLGTWRSTCWVGGDADFEHAPLLRNTLDGCRFSSVGHGCLWRVGPLVYLIRRRVGRGSGG